MNKFSKLSSGKQLVIQSTIFNLRNKDYSNKKIRKSIKREFDIKLPNSEIDDLFTNRSITNFEAKLNSQNYGY